MAHDIMNQFYAAHNLPLQEKLEELTRIIDLSIPSKDLQMLYPNLISYIFSSFHNGWGLRIITYDANKFEFELLTNFLGPQGPLFRLCYKLLSDPQLKYNLPLNALPFDLQMNIEKGRCPQFYADMLCMDSNSLNVVALALNPFDYYIFNYALHLVDHDQCKNSLDNWNSVYFALACDYLVHFLPCDPNAQVLPHISNYTGKVPMAALLQTVNRPLHSPSLLLLPGVTSISNQPSCSQAQSRNEVWRSETVLQVFIDIWMSVEQFGQRNTDFYTQSPLGPRIQPYDAVCSSLERVRVVRVFVKHIHTFSANHLSDPASRSSALRKYARQMMCTRAYHYVKLLVTTWPLDASFRLVMELWLSLIQPWRYTDSAIHQDRISESNEEVSAGVFDQSFVQFVAENYPSYTCIFQLVLSRFMRLDLTTLKNAIMLFRLGKVFSQPHLVPVLKELEQAITNNSGMFVNTESSYNNSTFDENYSNNNLGIQKWAAVAKQATSELNLSPNFQYEPIWAENKKEFSLQFVEKIMSYKIAADNIAKEMAEKLNQGQNGIWGTIKRWLMISISYEDEILMTECEKVPNYLLTSVRYFANIFELDASTLTPMAPIEEDVSLNSSYANASQFSMAITNKLRNNPTEIQYMGDPELKPITSYESTILVRIFYQIASKINGMFGERLQALWERRDLRGRIVREVLTAPCTVRRRAKLGVSNGTRLQVEQLPPRVSLRPLASHAFVARFVVGYLLFRFYSTSLVLYTLTLFVLYSLFVTVKALLKHIGIVKTAPY